MVTHIGKVRRKEVSGKLTEDEKEIFEERVAIITIDGEMPLSYARIKAWQQIEDLRKQQTNKEKTNEKTRLY
jgi:hypothetical protein